MVADVFFQIIVIKWKLVYHLISFYYQFYNRYFVIIMLKEYR